MFPAHASTGAYFGAPPSGSNFQNFIAIHRVPTAGLVAIAFELYPNATSSVVAIYEDGTTRLFSNCAPVTKVSTLRPLTAYLWSMLDAVNNS